MKRVISIFSATIMMVCLGGIYSWGLISDALNQLYSYSSWQTQLVYGTVIFTFTFLMIFTGKLTRKKGPRLSGMISGVFVTLSWLLTSFLGSNFILLFLCFGITNGIAISFGYSATLSIAVSAFPKHKGLVSGIIVAGYGAGAIILTHLLQGLIHSGLEILPAMRVVGVIYGPVVFICGLFLFTLTKPQPLDGKKLSSKISLPDLLKSRGFWALSTGILFGTLPGLILIGKISSLGLSFGHSAEFAAEGIIFISIGSMLGRVSWGFLNDHFKQKWVAILSLMSIFLSIMLLAFTSSHLSGFWISSFFIGFTYGGCLSIYPAQTASLYGATHVNEVYPFVLFAHGIAAAAGPTVGGFLIDKFNGFTPVFILVSISAGMGLILYTTLSNQPALRLKGKIIQTK